MRVLAWDQAEIETGIKSHKMALSADARYVLVADHQPHSLLVLDAISLEVIYSIDVKDGAGNTSRVSAVYTAAPRDSFIAALKDIPEIWQISYLDEPPVGFDGWVHDYRVDSGENTKSGPFPVRQIKLDNPLGDLVFDEEYVTLTGVSPDGQVQVVDLDLGRTIEQSGKQEYR
ncbi:MAG: hypothetical protein GY732_05740 [Gammaproteobacteria bacterium]|nr:hypothetical protein [Gammaproteobacteria bacterium]